MGSVLIMAVDIEPKVGSILRHTIELKVPVWDPYYNVDIYKLQQRAT